MAKMTDEEYREALKKKFTEKPRNEKTTYYSRTGFRKSGFKTERPGIPASYRPRRRIGLVAMLPILLLFMMSGRLQGVVFPLIAAVILYLWVKRRR